MRCDQIQALLSAYADGELSRKLAARVERHLGCCPECAAELRVLSRLVRTLRAMPAEDPPVGLDTAIHGALDNVRVSLWERIAGAAAPVQPYASLSLVGAAAGLLLLGLTGAPLQHGVLPQRPPLRLSYQIPGQPILPPSSPAEPDPLREAPAPIAATPLENPQAGSVSRPTVAQARASAPISRSPKERLVASRPRTAAGRAAERTEPRLQQVSNPAARAEGSPRAPAFDPLAPVLDPMGSPTEPAMVNVVIAEMPTTMPQPEMTLVASATPDSGAASGTADDDLAALRRRLEAERLQLPDIQLPPRRSAGKGIPILRSQF